MSNKKILILVLIFGLGMIFLTPMAYKWYDTYEEDNILTNGSCVNLSVSDLIEYGRVRKYPNGIPRIIHYVYKTQHIPSQYSPHVRQCMLMNNDTRFVFWTDKSAEHVIKKHFPLHGVVYQSYLESGVQPLKLSDVNRYFILFKFGGIYMDLDTRCQRPFDMAMTNRPCVLSTEVKEQTRILWNYEFFAMNSLMACVPNHDFFKVLIDKLTHADKTYIMDQTGPTYLTNQYLSYNKSSFNATEPTKSVVLADPYEFSPLTESHLENVCSGIQTLKWKIQGCKDLADHRRQQKQKEHEAVVVHLFMHLGYDFKKHKIKVKRNICLAFVNVVMVV